MKVKLKVTNNNEIRDLAIKPIKNGCRVRTPENNIEVLLFVIKEAPITNEFVMVAVNISLVKDIALFDQEKKQFS